MAIKKYRKSLKDLKELVASKRQMLIDWRKEHTVERIERPTNPSRARSLGYKAKKGFVMARVKIKKGGRPRRLYGRGGRKPKKAGLVHFTSDMGLRWIAEERAAKRFKNLEVLNSYYVGEDGKSKWFEVILADPKHPAISKGKNTKWISSPANKKRVLRGLTSAGKKSRELRH